MTYEPWMPFQLDLETQPSSIQGYPWNCPKVSWPRSSPEVALPKLDMLPEEELLILDIEDPSLSS
jgi:hypothetical protein